MNFPAIPVEFTRLKSNRGFLMKNIAVKVNPWKTAGKIKKLNGGNMAPPLYAEKAGMNLRDSYKALNLAITRIHDAPWDNPNTKIGDVSMIFANFHADSDDPRNYFFEQTDDYLRNCIENGTSVFYQLGSTIEHSIKHYFIDPPQDKGKWIDICAHIIRHYTKGWANGFHFPIQYWEIWNEPEGEATWGGGQEEFLQFYAEVATALKKQFPELKFGGPAHCGYADSVTPVFINYCAEHQVPLDFYSYHQYIGDPFGWIQKSPDIVRKQLDAAGFRDTEIFLDEWHYIPDVQSWSGSPSRKEEVWDGILPPGLDLKDLNVGTWKRMRCDDESAYEDKLAIEREMKGLDSAAFICAVMSGWQDAPVDMGAYYCCSATRNWGLYQAGTNVRTKSWFGMYAFGEIVQYSERLEAETSSEESTVLAGTDASGRSAVLVPLFKTGSVNLNIEFAGKVEVESVSVLDDRHDFSEFPFTYSNGKLELQTSSSSAVILVKFIPGKI